MTRGANPTTTIALIAGSGAEYIEDLRSVRTLSVDTPYGAHARGLARGEWHGQPLIYLPRHGDPHDTAPHRINYRANLWALKQLGVKTIFALGAVGGIRPQLLSPGLLAVPEQLIDYTWGREGSFYDGVEQPLQHIDFTNPFNNGLRGYLLGAAEQLEVSCLKDGVYGVTQGPRLETAAEIERLERDGCDMVGMTALPEAALARELGIDYGLLAVVVNAAAGRGRDPVVEEFQQHMAAAVSGALRVVAQAISNYVDAGPAG
ncbi:MAG: S-methyl-5'-thioinosine phosphorylase [Gammaproteobacteria bacterium]